MAERSVHRPIEDLGDAFGSLQQSLRSYLRRRLHDPVQAEDLLQDIFVKALTSERAGRRINNPAGWLYAAARTTLIASDILGETMQSLANKQKVSVSAIKSRAVRARTMVKEALLRCCRVETVNGVVTDYQRVSPPECRGKCIGPLAINVDRAMRHAILAGSTTASPCYLDLRRCPSLSIAR